MWTIALERSSDIWTPGQDLVSGGRFIFDASEQLVGLLCHPCLAVHGCGPLEIQRALVELRGLARPIQALGHLCGPSRLVGA